jgi:hypothetical protein
MSTLKSINVVHPSSAVNNIVNDASGNVSVGNNLTVAGTATLTGATTVGGVAVVAVAPSTAGNVLTSTGSAWASSAPAASLTLLATLTTTSGTTHSATGLATTYTNLVIVVNGVFNSTGGDSFQLEASVNNGSTWGTAKSLASPISAAYGAYYIYLASSSITPRPVTSGAGIGPVSTTSNISTTAASPINALRFSWSSGYTFNAGTIYIYGWN